MLICCFSCGSPARLMLYKSPTALYDVTQKYQLIILSCLAAADTTLFHLCFHTPQRAVSVRLCSCVSFLTIGLNSPQCSQWSLTLIHARCHFSSKAQQQRAAFFFVPRITLLCTFFAASLCCLWQSGVKVSKGERKSTDKTSLHQGGFLSSLGYCHQPEEHVQDIQNDDFPRRSFLLMYSSSHAKRSFSAEFV